MKDRRNRKVRTDSYPISVSRALFIRWMKKRGKWGQYKMESITKASKTDFEESWQSPMTPEDFLGRTSIMWETYCDWARFVEQNHKYFDDKLSEDERQLTQS